MNIITLKSKELKTKKEHLCEFCGDPIKSGSKARYRVYLTDQFNHQYQHLICFDDMQRGGGEFTELGQALGE